MAEFSVNQDYMTKMMLQITKKLQRDDSIKETMEKTIYDRWKQTPEYKSRQESAKMLLKEIGYLQSQYKKYSETALAIWLVYHGDRRLGAGGYGDFRHTVFSLDRIVKQISFPRLMDGTEVQYYRGANITSNKPLASRSGVDGHTYTYLSPGQTFQVGSSFRMTSSKNDVPQISTRQIIKSLEEMFGAEDVVARYPGVRGGGTLNTRLNARTIKNHMFGELNPITTSLGSKNAKDLFKRQGGKLPSKGAIDQIKKRDYEELIKSLSNRQTYALAEGAVTIKFKVDLLKDFEIYSRPIEEFMKSFEATLDTMQWETYGVGIARAKFQASNESKMVDFTNYGDFNRFLTGQYGAPVSHGGAEVYVGDMSGSPDTMAFYGSTYKDLSYYRLSEFYHTTQSAVNWGYSALLYVQTMK